MKRLEKEYINAYSIWKDNKIYWVKTYKTILKYVSEDYVDILKPRVTGTKTGKRYYVKKENLDNFIDKFEKNQLSK
jgi:hypothetical protein